MESHLSLSMASNTGDRAVTNSLWQGNFTGGSPATSVMSQYFPSSNIFELNAATDDDANGELSPAKNLRIFSSVGFNAGKRTNTFGIHFVAR